MLFLKNLNKLFHKTKLFHVVWAVFKIVMLAFKIGKAKYIIHVKKETALQWIGWLAFILQEHENCNL